MNRKKLINAITTKDVGLLKAAVGRDENKTIMIDSVGRYVDTGRQANEQELAGKTVIRFVERGGQ